MPNSSRFSRRLAPICLLWAASAQAQTTPPVRDSAGTVLRPVAVTVSRDAARSPFELPFATSRLVPDQFRPGQRRLSLADLLLGTPGVVVQERANPSQDPRLAIRGFGARSAFGVRGVRVTRDGLPLSLPDGQTPIDWLELESVGRVEVVRGTAAALYGNAAGGVVDFRSRDPLTPGSADVRWWNGGGLTRTTATVSAATGPAASANATRGAPDGDPRAGGLLTVTRTNGDGARQWSKMETTHAFARGLTTVGHTTLEVQGTVYDTPRAENTGALTAAELARDPALPDSLNITKHSRKAVRHQQLALIATHGNTQRSASASLFASTRTLDNPLPFAIIAIDRAVTGMSLRTAWRTTRPSWPLRLTAGVDAQRQDDSRLNFENCADVVTGTASVRCPTVGAERGSVRLDQRELVRGIGGFARAEVEAPHGVYVSVAARRDQVGFRVTDRFITATNADDSGERTLSATTPMLGVVWRIRPTWSAFVNWTTAFETPTITELTNQVDGAAGLNTALAPQRTRTAETGVHALVANRARLEVAAFRAIVQDELVPFDVPGAPGRRAFRNAGQTSRSGLETSVVTSWSPVDVGVSYTRSHFRFDQYSVGQANFAGNPIPGIPSQIAQLWATVRGAGVYGTVESTMASGMTANDAATVRSAGYAVWALRAGYDGERRWGRVGVEPLFGVDNLFDRHYAPSVVVNATRSRYYEPGLRRRVYLSMRVSAR